MIKSSQAVSVCRLLTVCVTKWIASWIIVFTAGSLRFLHAAPVGNAAAPQILEDGLFIPRDCWVDVRIGYEGDFVSDGKMNQHGNGSGRVDSYSQNTNSGTATLNILDRLDMYGVFGSSRTCAEWRFLDALSDVQNAKIQTSQSFLWAVGARAVLFEWGNCDLGLGSRYSSAHYSPLWLTINGINASVLGAAFHWRQWQINLDTSYHIDIFTPYIGVKYSSAETRLSGFSTSISDSGAGSNRFENRVPWGVYLGCSLSNGKYFMLNLEARLIDEEAVTVSGDLRF